MVKPGRHRQADAAHLGEVRALAAEQRLHRAVAVGLPAEEVDVLAGLSSRRRGLRLRGASRPSSAAFFTPSSPSRRVVFFAICDSRLRSQSPKYLRCSRIRSRSVATSPSRACRSRGVLGHHQHIVEKLRHRRLQRARSRRTPRGSRARGRGRAIAGRALRRARPAAPVSAGSFSTAPTRPQSRRRAATPLVMFFTRLNSVGHAEQRLRPGHLRAAPRACAAPRAG